MHLADTFIQSDLQCIQAIFFFYQYVCSLGIEPTTFCAANAMLYHWATGSLDIEKVSETKLEMEVRWKSHDPETRKMTASIWQQSCELWPTAAMHQIWSLMIVSRRQTIETKSVPLYSRFRPSHPVRQEKIVWAHGKQFTTVCSVLQNI